MSAALPEFLSDTVHIETSLPFDWQLMPDNTPPPAEQAANLTTLQLIETLDESSHAVAGEAEKHNEDLLRLEQKIDLVLQLLGQLLASQPKPELTPRPVVLGCHGMAWKDNQSLPANRRIRLSLYLHPDVNPLVMVGETVEVKAGDEYNCQVRFVEQPAEFENVFEKWIFRQHRRAIARQRARD